MFKNALNYQKPRKMQRCHKNVSGLEIHLYLGKHCVKHFRKMMQMHRNLCPNSNYLNIFQKPLLSQLSS